MLRVSDDRGTDLRGLEGVAMFVVGGRERGGDVKAIGTRGDGVVVVFEGPATAEVEKNDGLFKTSASLAVVADTAGAGAGGVGSAVFFGPKMRGAVEGEGAATGGISHHDCPPPPAACCGNPNPANGAALGLGFGTCLAALAFASVSAVIAGIGSVAVKAPNEKGGRGGDWALG